jgi:hypothetical protein
MRRKRRPLHVWRFQWMTVEIEVQEQEKGSLGEQSIFVVADSNDPVTNQEKQEKVSAKGLEMLEVVRSENGLSEQEQRSVEEEQPMCVAADSAVLVEGLDNSDAIPVITLKPGHCRHFFLWHQLVVEA